MNNNYLVEIGDQPVGILVREGSGYAFHALERTVSPLEGAQFADVPSAERAARRTLERSSRRTG